MIRTEHQPASNGIAARAIAASNGGARLPVSYENAKSALANCVSIDECKEWADKAAALASYAKQANDDELMKMATRIRGRASRRAGELLQQFNGQGNNQHGVGDHTMLSQRRAADEAGMSKHQQVQAVRIANVPDDQFETMVEGDTPATVTALAEVGKKPIIDLKGRDPKAFNRSLHFIAEFEEYANAISAADLDLLLPALTPTEAMADGCKAHARELRSFSKERAAA